MPAIFDGANLFRAFAFRGLDGHHQKAASGAGFIEGLVPDGEFTIRVTAARIENFTVAGFAGHHGSLRALGTTNIGIFGFFQGFNVFAFGVSRTADKFAEAAVTN